MDSRRRHLPRLAAEDLLIGERVCVEGGTKRVFDFDRRGEEPVFNLEVDADHCYRVGEQGILVHNASAYDPEGSKSKLPKPCDDECAISLCARKIRMMMVGSIARHAFVMVTKSTGFQTSYSGTVLKVKNSKGKEVDSLIARAFDFPSSEWGGEPAGGGYSCVHLGNIPCDKLYKKLDAVRDAINNWLCRYYAVTGPNSNSVANTYLVNGAHVLNGNIDIPANPPTLGIAPGWGDAVTSSCKKVDDE